MKGVNLWSGAKLEVDMQDTSPPVVVCLEGRRVCDVDYFESTSERVACFARPAVPEAAEANATRSGSTMQNALTMSERLCRKLDHGYPGGRVVPKDQFLRTGSGWCKDVKTLAKIAGGHTGLSRRA